jgi:hypothetical protein
MIKIYYDNKDKSGWRVRKIYYVIMMSNILKVYINIMTR